jgi:hypothetical protein
MQKTNSAPEAKAEIDKQEALKKRAAKQAAKRELAPETYPIVECTVLPMGDGKISMGEHVPGLGTAHYEEGETFPVILPIALALYERGYVNFEGARDAQAEAGQGPPTRGLGRARRRGRLQQARGARRRLMKTHLFRSSAGVDHWMIQDGNETRFAATQDVAPMLERNKQMATHNDGYTPSRDAPRRLHPLRHRHPKWLNEEGWWFMDAGQDPDVAKKLAAKLNSSEYLYLRTAEGRVGVRAGSSADGDHHLCGA